MTDAAAISGAPTSPAHAAPEPKSGSGKPARLDSYAISAKFSEVQSSPQGLTTVEAK